MSLLTKEQQTRFALIKKRFTETPKMGPESIEDYAIEDLIAIVDDLQARAPKQYTEQELREWFENRPLVQDEIDALLHEVVPGENEAWYSVLKFAAHVGALKAEP